MTYPWTQGAWRQCLQGLKSDRMAHAILLSGPAGLGKLELAQQLSAALLCLQPGDDDQGACGQCRSCSLLASGAHPDFRLLTFEVNEKTDKMRTELVIDQVRRLISLMQLTHSLSERKLALIHPVEAMNRNAANALLKTLEEPPGAAFLLLVSNDPGRLPATIRSRCQAVDIRMPDRAAALRWLSGDQGVDAALAAVALQAAGGAPLLARHLLESGEVDQYHEVQQALNELRRGAAEPAAMLEKLLALPPENLWTWLSLMAADAVRNCYTGGAAAASPDQPAGQASRAHPGQRPSGDPAARVRALADLQLQADRNRRLLATQLRKDLLLRDWLIQWAASGHG